jgi:hypothetical protein
VLTGCCRTDREAPERRHHEFMASYSLLHRVGIGRVSLALFAVGAVILVASLVFLGPDNTVDCGSQAMAPGEWCVPYDARVLPRYEDARTHADMLAHKQDRVDPLATALQWIAAGVGIVLMVAGPTLWWIDRLERRRRPC